MEKYKICPSCGKHNTTKAIECRYCEMSLAGVKPTDDETEAARAETEAKQTEANKSEENQGIVSGHTGQTTRICSECGTHNPPNARKCFVCGEDISDIIPTTETEIQPEPVKECRYLLESFIGDFVFELPKDGCVIGRHGEMADYLKSKSFVSRKHASFSYVNDDLFIENLSKTNFTYVNNVRISDKQKLKAGDEIGLGGNVSGGQRQELAAYFLVKQE